MTSNRDDLEKALQQNLKLRRELGAEVVKAKSLRARHISDASRTRHDPSPKLTTSEARQGTGPRAMFWVLIGSLFTDTSRLGFPQNQISEFSARMVGLSK